MLRTCLKVFGLQVSYVRAGVSVPLSKVVFDDNFVAIDPQTGAEVQSSGPMIGVRYSELPAGGAMSGDQVVVTGARDATRNGTYRVISNQRDSEGRANLVLHKT